MLSTAKAVACMYDCLISTLLKCFKFCAKEAKVHCVSILVDTSYASLLTFSLLVTRGVLISYQGARISIRWRVKQSENLYAYTMDPGGARTGDPRI